MEVLGRIRMPNLANAPSSPMTGEMYYDVPSSTLLWWDGSNWQSGKGGGGGGTTEVNVSTGGPSPRAGELLWVDTDEFSYGNAAPLLVTALPTSPADGAEVYFQADVANGVNWHLRYNAGSASPYKWELVGGALLYAEVPAAEVTASASYVALTTPGPTLTTPLAGDYDVGIGFRGLGTNGTAIMSYAIGATAAVDADWALAGISIAGGTTNASVERTRRKTGLAAATALSARYRSGASMTFADRWMTLVPVRVG